jgi:SlyX protein
MTESQAPDASALTARLEDRLTQLEIKASYSEDLLDHLNQTVIEQQRQIDALMREVVHLRQQAPAAGDGQPFRSLRDELPPHY